MGKWSSSSCEVTEKELIRVMLEFGHENIELDLSVAAYLVHELQQFSFENADYQMVIGIYTSQLEKGRIPDSDFFISHHDQ